MAKELELVSPHLRSAECGSVEFTGVDPEKTAKLAESAITDEHHVKAVKPLPSRKMNKPVPLTDCYVAPCKEDVRFTRM